ncbi:Type I restriction-modification system, restriction subunit R [Pseudomonas chlororaphis subsp. aurantiaca]|uniref:type I restriction endonuclease subunit R n=1 Tax=Pseudomonas chlororaphis TaxID=587753 RepID=UPI000F57DAD5|nr:DEAD/DEAH box helicase family protein [Pseudomonas chlororaphis]AZD54279.1 Type I restriction-modification system, restriction subunit R [Pseudomonas chlororaphis subsp. aurantiaca]
MNAALFDTAHQERHFEEYVIKQLASRGWLVGKSSDYDQNHALYPEDLVEWIKVTQPKKWDKLVATNGEKTPATLMARLTQALEKNGTVHILRNGFKIAGAGEIALSEGLPEDERDPSAWERYKANRLRLVPQLNYRPGSKLAIDLVFFINGLPVATVEIKTDFTQSAAAAVDQYKNDRLPKDAGTGRIEPLLTFKRGAVVHFAMSDSDIQMATKLTGVDTYFLPFNLGRDGHAGNPERADGEYPVAYFWEQVCAPDNWLRIFHSFVYTEKKEVVDLSGNHHRKETQIFPRFHQWDAVTKMIADAKANGPGQMYLCEHSAGSGKTSTIAWTAHDLIRLRTPDKGEPYFHSVIVVTDRTVLDKQLQDAVQQIDHQHDLIAAIGDKDSGESKSKELARALERQTPIIVVTIQTFPYAMEQILTNGKLSGRNFAVIIDEAHTGQTGAAASKLQATLALRDAKAMEGLTVEELLETIQSSRARPKNVSYFAFTATPKHATITLFGRPTDPSRPASKDNLPQSFHKYPMRQAIEEGFILDVLKGYLPYKTAFNLAEPTRDGKRIDGKAAKRALAKWLNLHATNVTQKVEFIIEHFAANVAPLLGGTAKAMIVTSSRASAVRYKKAFDAYIEANPQHKAYQALVAFSGSLTGKEVIHTSDELLANDVFASQDDEQFTESSMNPRQYGSDLRKVFDRPEFRVMIVANKFQTGFDQPKLCAMYLDKKIANPVEMVQTLSRLNRIAPGKDTIFAVDFVNDPQAILEAFAKYDAGARIEEVQDPNVIYDLQSELDKAMIYTTAEVEAYTAVRFKSAQAYAAGEQSQHKALYAATSAPAMRFNRKVSVERAAIEKTEAAYEIARLQDNEVGMKAADAARATHAEQLKALMDFKSRLTRFGSLYTYIVQTIDLGDPSLEAFASFARLLSKRLEGIPPDQVDVSALVLTGFDIKPKDLPNEGGKEPDVTLKPIGPGGGGQPPIPVYLRQVIARLNSIFGEVSPLIDKVTFVNYITEIAREDPHTMAQVANNPREVAMEGNINGTVKAGVVHAMTSQSKLAEHLMKHDQQAMAPLVNLVYELLKAGKNIDISDLGG